MPCSTCEPPTLSPWSAPPVAPFPPRCVPWLHAQAADLKAVCADALDCQSLAIVTTNAQRLVAATSTVATQLTADRLAVSGVMSATGLVAIALTATGDVAIADGAARIGRNRFGPQLITVLNVGPTNAFVLPPDLASGATVLFPASLPAPASCLLPTAPAPGLTLYVANASAGAAATIAAPPGAALIAISAPAFPLISTSLGALLTMCLLWTGSVWIVSAA